MKFYCRFFFSLLSRIRWNDEERIARLIDLSNVFEYGHPDFIRLDSDDLQGPVGDQTLDEDNDTYYEVSDAHNSVIDDDENNDDKANDNDDDINDDNDDNDDNNDDDVVEIPDDHLLGATGGNPTDQPTEYLYDHASDELVRTYYESRYGDADLIKKFLAHVSACLADTDGTLKEISMAFEPITGISPHTKCTWHIKYIYS